MMRGPTVRTDRRIYRAADGQLVWEGDPLAATLEYPAGWQVPESVVSRVGNKRAGEAHDKQAGKPADKSGAGLEVKRKPKRPPASGPGSGVEAWREYVAAATGEDPETLADLSRDDLMQLVT